jgi:hypothetical protein
LPIDPNVTFTSILTTGNTVAGAPTPFVGTPDGIGAFDNGDGTVTVVVDHELAQTAGAVRGHGSTGSFVDRLVINKFTLQVVSEQDAVTSPSNTFTDADGDGVWTAGTTAWERFCSGDLAAVNAYFNPATGLGTTDRIYLTGEETSPPFTTDYGRAWAFVLTGANAGQVYELPRMGQISYENLVANPFTGNRTVVMSMDDTGNGTTTGGQVYMYLGDKLSSGNAVQKAGLTDGSLFAVHVNGLANNKETESLKLPGDSATFTMVPIPDESSRTGVQMEADSVAAGATEFLRPEDGAWDPTHPNWFYFNTTASFNGPSHLWRLEYNDINSPAAGGTIRMLLTGTEGYRMLDNMTVTADGKVVLVEDVGNNAYLGRELIYDPVTDTLTPLGAHDPARFVSGGANFITQDEEASGPIDVTSMFGNSERHAVLFDSQAHNALANPLVEGGQLQIMYLDKAFDGGFFGDFGGDHKSDVFIRNDAGAVAVWQLDGGRAAKVNIIGSVGPEWHVDSANADFNGDGKADVLWRADNGTVMIWQMNGTQFQSAAINSPGSDSIITGTGDFNGDGKGDILWSRTDGTIVEWQMNGSQIQSSATVGQVGREWHVEGIGDFNGDGKSDLLQRNDAGQLKLFLMNGAQIQSAPDVGSVGLEWHVRGLADFNGDGKQDVLWQNNNGQLMEWQMNGAQIQSSQTLNGLPADWHIFGTADVDADGKGDILWRNHDGTVAVWEMNGAQIVGSQTISPLGPDWTLGTHHFDFV